jgi:membrane protease YdiL (CAAX protease family)
MEDKNLPIRYLQVLLFVAVYVALGLAFKLDVAGYQLLAIPLVLGFQLLIRKQPVQTLWVRDYYPFTLNKWGIALAVALAIHPVKVLVEIALKGNFAAHWAHIGFTAAVLAGAFAAGYSYQRFTKATWRLLLLCLAIAGGIGLLLNATFTVLGVVLLHKQLQPNPMVGFQSFIRYIPVAFILEEVVFRGLLDAHLYQPQQARGWGSAIFVSVLWGLWHYPVAPHGAGPPLVQIGMLIFVHTAVGVPLSMFWRRSGNLGVPVFTHAFIDAVRDALV